MAPAPRQLGDRTARGRMNTCADGTADKMIRCLISIFAVLLLVAPAESAEITVSRMGSGDTLVRVYGPIEHGDDTTFDRLTKPITELVSYFGLVGQPWWLRTASRADRLAGLRAGFFYHHQTCSQVGMRIVLSTDLVRRAPCHNPAQFFAHLPRSIKRTYPPGRP